jgi:hypothetical protein
MKSWEIIARVCFGVFTHSGPAAANPASMPGCPLRRTSTRPHEGARRSKAKAKARRPTGRPDLGVCSPVMHLVGWQAAIASRLAPTEEQRQRKKQKQKPRTPAALHHSTGRALARLQLLILIHPPPRQAEWRCLSGDRRAAPFDAVELIACRSREADRRAMPPDECRSEGTPSPSEGPDVRGERFFAYFF